MMNFSLYSKKRVATPTPAQLLLLKQRQQHLQMMLLAKNKTSEPVNHENRSENENKIVEHEIKEEKDV